MHVQNRPQRIGIRFALALLVSGLFVMSSTLASTATQTPAQVITTLHAGTATPSHATPAADAAVPEARPTYNPQRDEENWRGLHGHASVSDPFDHLKNIVLGTRRNTHLTISGEVRYWDEHYVNKDWNPANGSSAYLLPRYLLGLDYHEPRLHAFVQLESASANGRKGGSAPIYRDDIDPTDAYLGWRFGDAHLKDASFDLLVGRQELNYGAGRIISLRDGAGTRQSFDGLRMILRSKAWRLDAFTAHPVIVNAGSFDDAPDEKQALSGFYAARILPATNFVETYVLSDYRAAATYGRGTAGETRYSLGGRIGQRFGRVGTELGAAYQFGTYGSGPTRAQIIADYVSGNLTYNFGGRLLVPTLKIAAGAATGDHDPHANILRTFIPPSFRGSYFGALQENGPANSLDFAPTLTLVYRRNTSLALCENFIRQATSNDAIYNLTGSPIRPAAPGASIELGGGPVITLIHNFDRHLQFTSIYERFNAGRHFDGSPPSGTIQYNRYVLDYIF